MREPRQSSGPVAAGTAGTAGTGDRMALLSPGEAKVAVASVADNLIIPERL
jgi:hypothetical protein